jgi:hypothetical protein
LLETIEDEKPVVSIADVGDDIKKIDTMLLNPNLTEEQVNELLDRRSNL